MKKQFLAFLFSVLVVAAVHAQTSAPLPVPINPPIITDFGNGPLKLRVVAGPAYIFTVQGSGTGSTSGSSTSLTLTGTPTTPPKVGAVISGTGIASGTTVAAYNGTTGVTLSAAMTVAPGTALSWGGSCPTSMSGVTQFIQAQPATEYWQLYTQARVCASSPGGPQSALLPLPYDTPSSGGGTPSGPAGGVLSGTYPNPGMAAGAAATNVGAMGGDLTGTLPNPQIAANTIVNADVNTAAAIAYSKMQPLAANTVLGALTATTATGLAMPDTTGASVALGWTAGVGFGAKTIPTTTPGGSSGQIQYNNGGAFGGFTASGDATVNTGTGALTLATVNSNVGSFGSATQCVTFTTNGKGLITAASATACTPPLSAITGLGTGVATQLALGVSTPGGSTATIASGSNALGTGSISSAACASAVSPTATGVTTTDAIAASFNADPSAVTGYIPSVSGMLTIFVYPTSNAVNFKVCNNTATAITPGAVTVNWRVVR